MDNVKKKKNQNNYLMAFVLHIILINHKHYKYLEYEVIKYLYNNNK